MPHLEVAENIGVILWLLSHGRRVLLEHCKSDLLTMTKHLVGDSWKHGCP